MYAHSARYIAIKIAGARSRMATRQTRTATAAAIQTSQGINLSMAPSFLRRLSGKRLPTDALAPGRSHQPCGGYRETPFPSGSKSIDGVVIGSRKVCGLCTAQPPLTARAATGFRQSLFPHFSFKPFKFGWAIAVAGTANGRLRPGAMWQCPQVAECIAQRPELARIGHRLGAGDRPPDGSGLIKYGHRLARDCWMFEILASPNHPEVL